MPRRSFNEHTGGWSLLRDSLEKTIAEFPYLAPLREELAALLVEVQRRKTRLAKLKGDAAKEARLLREALDRGRALEVRARGALLGVYGSSSDELVRHGIRPRRKKREAPPADLAGSKPDGDPPEPG
jgi:hypothetical protein